MEIILRDRAAQDVPHTESIAVVVHQAAPEAVSGVDPLVVFYGELVRARVAAQEAFERGAARLLDELARDVLGRELAIERSDLDAMVRRLRSTFTDNPPVAVIVAPSDVASIDCDVPVRPDATLVPGDVIFVVADGTVDARLTVRLNAALRSASS